MTTATNSSTCFWREINPVVANSLSDEQRAEIERVLGSDTVSQDSEVGDLRLSFKWFFVRLVWGAEKRSPERIKQEAAAHPAISRRHIPILTSLFTGYAAVCYAAAAGGAMLVMYIVA